MLLVLCLYCCLGCFGFRVCLRFGGVVKFAFGVVFICWLGCWFTVIWWLLVAGWFWACSLLMLFTG